MWARIDQIQLDGFQVFATWFERLTGRSYFDAARFAIVLAFASSVAGWFNETDRSYKIFMAFIVLIAVFVVWICFLRIGQLESLSRRGNFANPERHSHISSMNRGIQSFFAFTTIVGLFAAGWLDPGRFVGIGLWAYHYLIACETPPPWEVKEDVENLTPQST